MSSIQAHHAKLWFAGKAKNWKLANFEIKELNEIISDIETFQKERKETAEIKMIYPAINSVNKAITEKDISKFTISYNKLTNQ